jgi:hypothetical protein
VGRVRATTRRGGKKWPKNCERDAFREKGNSGVPLATVLDEAPDPIDVGGFGADGIVGGTERLAGLIQKTRLVVHASHLYDLIK